MASTTRPTVLANGQAVSPTSPSSRSESIIRTIERHAIWVLAVLMLLAAALLLHMGQGLSFFFDDWDFVTHDYGGGIHSLLAAHVGNISIFPVAVYKVLFHLVGLSHYAVFRLVVVVLHLLCGGLVFVLAARRAPRTVALLAAALILFLGAAWEDLLWAFQVGYLLSAAGGLAAWVLLDRRGRIAELAAMLCLLVAAGSSSLGIAVMVGVAVELAWQRRWRSGWIVIIPAVLYALWYLSYGESQLTENGLINAPGFAEDLAAAAFGGLVGRGLEWGRPVALFGALVVARRLISSVPLSPRLAGLLAAGFTLWAITAVARSTISQPEASRYIYLGAVVIVLVGVELVRDVPIEPRAIALASVVVALCAITGMTALHNGALGLRATSTTVTAELGALELAAAKAPPAPQIQAGPYLHTVRAIGSSPADTPYQIAAADSISRSAADAVLLALYAPKLVPGASLEQASPPPTVMAKSGGQAAIHGACVELTPGAAGSMSDVLLAPSGGVLIRDRGNTPATVALARFGDGFAPLVGAATPHADTTLALPRDRAPQGWRMQISSTSALSICG
jgi:hypothetical protein